MHRGLLALLASLLFGCQSVLFSLNPFATDEVTVLAAEPHGAYRFVDVHGEQLRQRFITAASDVCARVLAPEAQAEFQRRGTFGRFEREDETCEAVGTLSLADRRAQRREGDSPVPRTTARFTVLHRDAQYIQLQGRFALASRVGVPSAFDIVAVVPDNETCREVAARGEASLEFRTAGSEPFRLLASGQSCVVEGFALPPGGPSGAPS